MDDAILAYFGSVAQVLAALAGLLAVFSHFRITDLRQMAIGIGKAIEVRWLEDPGYALHIHPKLGNHKQSHGRLRDAVWRGDMYKIREVINECVEVERPHRHESDHGFAASLRRFDRLMARINDLNELAKFTVVTAVLGIASSLGGIVAVHIGCCSLKHALFVVSSVFGLAALVALVYTVTKGMRYVPQWKGESDNGE